MTDNELLAAVEDIRRYIGNVTATRDGRKLLKALGVSLADMEELDGAAEDVAKTILVPGVPPSTVWIEFTPTFQPRPFYLLSSSE